MKTIGRYLIALIILSGIFALVLDKFVMPTYVGSHQVRYLPSVIGMSFEEASRRLEREGFQAKKEDVKFTSQYTPGTVIDQYPKPRRRVKPGRTIRLTVADEERMLVVPNVVGTSLRSAELEIEQIGLRIEERIKEYDAEVPRDVIKWQYPRAGDHLRRGSGIKLIISLGRPPNFYQVPQLFGLLLPEAEQLLLQADLKVGRIRYRQNEDLVPYTVLEQSIEEGTILDHPVAIDLTVSIIDLNDIHSKLTSPE